MEHPEFEDAKIEYERFRAKYYESLAEYNGDEGWDQYRKTFHRYDENDWVELYLLKRYKFLTDRFLEKNPFLKPYYARMKNNFIMKSGRRKVRVELFNIDINDLYYPRYKEVLSVHSAKHSLAMFIKEGILNQKNKDAKFALYMRPKTTHPGDREFTHYYLSTFNFPHIILTRQENLSWFLRTNGIMKQQHFGGGGRWCTRVFKTEPSVMLYREYFWSWRYKFTKTKLIEYCKKHHIGVRSEWKKDQIIEAIIKRLKDSTKPKIPPPNKMLHIWNNTLYPIYKWNPHKVMWNREESLTNEIPIYEEVTKLVGTSKRFVGWKKTSKTRKIYNLFQSLAINKYHSQKRRRMNPNFIIHPKATPNTKFVIYSRHPLYEETPIEMDQIINKGRAVLARQSPHLTLEENPFERDHPLAYSQRANIEEEEVPPTEERFGCIICPYRPLEYFKKLKENFPYQYFYCMTIRLVASAKNIIREGREYWYEYETKKGREVENPIMSLM